MIDPVTFVQIVLNNAIVPVIHTPLVETDLTENQKMLLNPLAYGFSLGDKIWGAIFSNGSRPFAVLTLLTTRRCVCRIQAGSGYLERESGRLPCTRPGAQRFHPKLDPISRHEE